MLTAEQAGLPEIDYLAESQPDPTLTTPNLFEATLRAVPDVGEAPAAQLPPEELGRPLATAANKSRPAKLVGLAAALATGASLVSACGPGYTETVDCTKVRRLDSRHVKINPASNPAKVAIKTESGVRDIAFFRKITKKTTLQSGATKRTTSYEYRSINSLADDSSYRKVPKGESEINGTTVVNQGGDRPEVVCPQ